MGLEGKSTSVMHMNRTVMKVGKIIKIFCFMIQLVMCFEILGFNVFSYIYIYIYSLNIDTKDEEIIKSIRKKEISLGNNKS